MEKIVEAYKRFLKDHAGLFPLSVNVDLILLLLGLKSAMRTQLQRLDFDRRRFECWCKLYDFEFEIANENFIYFAKSMEILTAVIALDSSFESHEKALGLLLGYPECCCKKITQIGEMGIDQYEEWLVSQKFEGPFQLINTKSYGLGKAFISHVPCSNDCVNSLEIAKQVSNFFITHRTEKAFWPWLEELEHDPILCK